LTANPAGDRGYPYTYNTIQKVAGYEMTRGLVMVPIATALAFIAILLFVFGSYKLTAWADFVSSLISGLVRYADQ